MASLASNPLQPLSKGPREAGREGLSLGPLQPQEPKRHRGSPWHSPLGGAAPCSRLTHGPQRGPAGQLAMAKCESTVCSQT